MPKLQVFNNFEQLNRFKRNNRIRAETTMLCYLNDNEGESAVEGYCFAGVCMYQAACLRLLRFFQQNPLLNEPPAKHIGHQPTSLVHGNTLGYSILY